MAAVLKRVFNIMLRPRHEWALIKTEGRTRRAILFGYVAGLTFIPVLVVSTAAAVELLTHSGELTVYRSAAWHEFRLGVGWYVVNSMNVLIMGEVFQCLISALVTKEDNTRGLKISAYSATPLWIAMPLAVVPSRISALVVLCGLMYSFYLMYLAVPGMVDNKPRRSGWLTVKAVAVSAIFIAVADIIIIGSLKFAEKAIFGIPT